MKQKLGQLLCNGTSAARTFLHKKTGFNNHAGQTLGIDAGMPVKSFVFRGNQRIDKMIGQFIIINIGPVLVFIIK